MTSPTIKLLAGASIVSIGVPSSYAVYLLTAPKTIRDQLERNNYIILDTAENSDSNTSDHDYSKWQEKIKDWNQITNFIGSSSINEEKQKISAAKNKCKSILDKEINDEDYKNAEKYCAIKAGSQ